MPLAGFSSEMLTDAFLQAQAYNRRVKDHDPEIDYWSIGWNYMPPAGGSQVHPHLSVLGQFLPTPLEEKVFSASKRYQELNGSIFWKALIEKEKESHERYLADIGQTS